MVTHIGRKKVISTSPEQYTDIICRELHKLPKTFKRIRILKRLYVENYISFLKTFRITQILKRLYVENYISFLKLSKELGSSKDCM